MGKMRNLTDHIVGGDSANHQLQINVLDEAGHGGASHMYSITGLDISRNSSYVACDSEFPSNYDGPEDSAWIVFQNGPIKEFGVNGVTQEALLAICIDRMRCFQAGPFACEANQLALDHMLIALRNLQTRTRERIARGVEGTHAK